MPTAEYVRRVEAEVSRATSVPPGSDSDWGSLLQAVEVRMDRSRSQSTPDLVVLFRAAHRPGCVFRYRIKAVGEMGPEAWAGLALTHIEEIVLARGFGCRRIASLTKSPG